MSHLKMWEIMERAAEGPYCEDDEFLYDLFLPKMQEVLSKYEIKYDPATPGAGRRRPRRPHLEGGGGVLPRRWACTTSTRTAASSSPRTS